MKVEYDLGVAQVRRIVAVLESCGVGGFDECALTSLTHRLWRAMAHFGIRTPEILEQRLSDGGNPFCTEFVRRVLPSTTELFRDPAFWVALRDEVLPVLRSRELGALRIWLASFDSGEELYSLCALLDAMGLLDESTIYASQLLDGEGLRSGLHLPSKRVDQDRVNASAVLGEEGVGGYFCSVDGGWQLPGELIGGVRFVRQSIRFSAWEETPVHLVLCRNHLLYYSTGCGSANLETLANSLQPGGVLAVGIGEDLANYQNGSKFTVLNGAESLYRRLKM